MGVLTSVIYFKNFYLSHLKDKFFFIYSIFFVKLISIYLSIRNYICKILRYIAWDAAWDILGKSRDYLSTALSLHQESPDVSDQGLYENRYYY